MTTYDMANERITDDLINNKIDNTSDNTNANNYAKNIMNTYDEDVTITKQQQQQYQQYQQPQQPQQPQQYQQEPPPPRQQQYQPPIPPREQQPFPQQSQHMNATELSSAQPNDGNYSGFDMSDNLSSLDSAFNSIKVPTRAPTNVNSTPQLPKNNDDNGNIEAFYPSNIDKFGLF